MHSKKNSIKTTWVEIYKTPQKSIMNSISTDLSTQYRNRCYHTQSLGTFPHISHRIIAFVTFCHSFRSRQISTALGACGDPVIQTNQLWEILAHGCLLLTQLLTQFQENLLIWNELVFRLEEFYFSPLRNASFAFVVNLLHTSIRGLMLTLMLKVEKFSKFSELVFTRKCNSY